MRQIILDTETTGLDPLKGHRLTEIGCLEMINRRLTGRKFHTYINPEREIDKEAIAITGLTIDFLSDKPKFIDVAEQFLQFLQYPNTELIIHNAPFDLGFLNNELMMINHPWSPLENYLNVIDTLVMARNLHPGQRNNLDVLCKRYNVDNSHREYHGALLDAELLSKVYLAMTAGQTSLMLSETGTSSSGVSTTKVKLKKVRRSGAPLLVIRANEAERKLHEERLSQLQKQSEG